MKQPQAVAIIPARGGSRRLQRKNVLPFCGLPLVKWSIIQACCSYCLGPENTYLTTDDDEIEEIGRKYGIHIIRRPDLGDPDKIAANTVIIHAIREIRKRRNFDVCIDPLPTSPIRLPDDIDRVYARYCELKPLYPDCCEVNWTIPQPEIAVHKYLDDARMSFWLWNKSYWFGLQGVHTHLYEPDHYIKSANMYSNDIEIDESNRWMLPGGPGRCMYYIQGKWFQGFEIDNRDTFELCEILMERYVLKGRGTAAYEEYRDRGKGK